MSLDRDAFSMAPCAFVLGAGGYLGTHVAQALRDAGIDVVVGTRGAVWSRAVRINPIVDDPTTLRATIAAVRPDVVVNCIGKASGPPTELVDSNVVVATRVAEAMCAAVPQARLVHIGSAGEYGKACPQGASVDETVTEQPVSNYGITKLAGTRALLAGTADRAQDAVVLRVFNPVGPGAPAATLPGWCGRLFRAAVQADRHDPVEVAPLGTYRDFVDVRDVASAVVAAATAPQLRHQVYNVGSGVAAQSRDLVVKLAQVAGFRGELRETKVPADRSRGVEWQRADIGRAAEDLGWKPQHDLDSSVRALWRWISC